MEDTLRDIKHKKQRDMGSLNPCFNGRYSQRGEEEKEGLNNLTLS